MELDLAIQRYELFLRSYVYGMRLAGSPYAFHSIGSAMACRARAYVRCGGMNTRKAGEDFYFLQKLAKTDGVDQLRGTTVMPSARISERVPFGTGRSMARISVDDCGGVLVYPVDVFRVINQWLTLVNDNHSVGAEELLIAAATISPVLADYLARLDWCTVWLRMQSTHRSQDDLIRAFHIWFDGFKSLRLIHQLCEELFQRGEPELLLPDYFAWGETDCPAGLPEMLEKLRCLDGR